MCGSGVGYQHKRLTIPQYTAGMAGRQYTAVSWIEANARFIAHVRQCLQCRVDMARDK